MELLLFATLALAAQGADVPNNAPMKIEADSVGGFLQQASPSTLVAASLEREAALVDKASKRATAGVAVNKPNVLLVLVDDQGHGDIDLGVGKAEFHTPTLATMASEGVRLSNFYSSATCTPSRAMLMTGRYAMRYGFQDSVIHATEPRGVPLSETFLSEKMQKVGYTTAMIGKWCVPLDCSRLATHFALPLNL
jgi:membrane-anchored protein YejM (alkaline phosphatase superfamily)